MLADPYVAILIIVALVSLIVGLIIGVMLVRPTITRY